MSKNRGYRWIAAMLTMALLVGQCHVPVLAQEETAPAGMGISDENKDGTQMGGADVADQDVPKDDEDDGTDNGVGNDGAGAGSDNGGAGEGGNGETGSDNGGADDDGEGSPGVGGDETGDAGENQGGEEGAPDKCVCETACAENAVNEDCPVCAADYAFCAKNAGGGVKPSEKIEEEETVSENDLDEDVEVALMAAHEDMETYADNGTIWDEGSHLWYRVLRDGGDEVEVKGEDPNPDNRVGNVIIPESIVKDGTVYRVTGIGATAFKKSYSLKTVSIPASVERIGDNAFLSSYLSDVTIPEGVTEIGESAFQWSRLKSITIPGSVRSMGRHAFASIGNLKSVTIKEGVASIGEWTFSSCENLTRVEIPASMTSIGEGVFSDCVRLTSVTIPAGVTEIKDCAFAGSGLTSVEIPQGVTKIETAVFEGCKNLTRATIPEGVTKIQKNAFFKCGSLTAIEIPQNVTQIGEAAFYKCEKLTSVEIPQGVTRIENYTFASCTSLNHVEIPQSVTRIENYAFESCTSLNHVEIPRGVTRIGNYAFASCTSLNHVEIPQGVTRIENYTFASCTSLNNMEIPGNVTSIGEGAFETCSSLASVTISEKISMIGVEAFKDCNQLKTLNIVVSSDENIRFPQVGKDAFVPFPDNNKVNQRYIRFFDTYDTSKNELRGQAYTDAFTEAAQNDGDSDNGRWYGWSYEGVTIDTYTVTINVKKDGNPWSGHGKTFALLGGGGSGFLEVPGQTGDSTYSLSQVPDGTYRIFDITGVPADSLYSRARDTGMDVRVSGADTQVDVTVNGADEEKDVHYYTATFYDGADDYKAGTPQEPQIVLQGRQVLKPTDPSKADYDFAGWKTRDGGSTSYDFAAAVTDTTRIFASWVKKTAEQLHITASAAEGGTISPTGDIAVTKGGEQTFTITPGEGYQIKTVTVDGRDATAELKDTLARAQAGARYYTFTNVMENHTIHAAFEKDGNTPGGGDKPDDGDDKPDDGGDQPGGEEGAVEVTIVSQTSAPQTQGGQGMGSGGTSVEAKKADAEGTAAEGREPKTGDATQVEIYATVAMIAGLTYLLLYFMDEGRGMTEREKEVFVAAFIRWAKKGGRFRRCCAIAAIFCLLVYYHSIGKRAGGKTFDRECLRQAL